MDGKCGGNAVLQHTIYFSSRGERGRDGEGELGLAHIGYIIRSLIFIGSSKGICAIGSVKKPCPMGFSYSF